jgi:hypothetical protein
MKPDPYLLLPQDLPPETARVLFELADGLADRLWQQYGDQWDPMMRPDRHPYPSSRQVLDFDDEIPF